MATNWITLAGSDIRLVLDALAQYQPNQNTAEGTAAGDEVDLNAANRRDQMVTLAVSDLRSAIAAAGRHPLAVTANTIPPEAKYHCLVIAAWRLLNSTPSLAKSFLVGDGSAETPLGKLHSAARAYVWGAGTPPIGGLAQGATMTPPTDPTGQDYATAADDDPASLTYNPSLRSVRWGDLNSNTDVDYARGYSIDPVTGGQMGLPVVMSI